MKDFLLTFGVGWYEGNLKCYCFTDEDDDDEFIYINDFCFLSRKFLITLQLMNK